MIYPIIRWAGIGFFLILILALIVIPVKGETFRPAQGDMVQVGTVIDITGCFGWSESFAWYGSSGSNMDPLYILPLPDTKSGYYQFYVDPAIFSTRLGPWYQYYGNSTEPHGYDIAFRVVKELPKTNITNVTPTATPTPVPTLVQRKRFDSDYQIARGDSFSVTINNKSMPSRLWVFGRVDGMYNRSYPKSVVTLSADELRKLELGTYQFIVQNPGKNGIFEVGYSKIVDVQNSKTTEQLTSPWAAVKPISVFGFQPSMVLIKFLDMVKATDDPLTRYTIELAQPTIEIVSVDETYYEGKDVVDIRGYTNVAKDSPVLVVMDEEDRTARTFNSSIHMAIVKEDSPNAWRYFQIYLLIDYETIPVGQHQITASTPQGARQSVPFYVYDLPKGQETPNETIKYIAGNQFLAPVTVTITIPVPGPTQTIFVPVTPSNEQVYAQQKIVLDQQKAQKDAADFFRNVVIVVIIIFVVIGLYLIRVIKKARLR